MKRGMFIFVIFIFCNLILGSVYINEVEINPGGTDSGFEWAELYNDGGGVDLTGWYIADRDVNQFFFPSIIIGDFYVLDNLNGFVNSNENLSLFNSNNILQDNTGLLSDSDNNNKTWQRAPDGIGNFVFKNMTKESTNNQILNVPSQYSTIQNAIDASYNGDVINVASGVYNEDLIINKGIMLQGEGYLNTSVINGAHIITTNDVFIQGFIFSPGSGVAITIDSSLLSIDNILINNSLFNLTDFPSIGIYIGGGNPVNKLSNIKINNNIFNGPSNKVCNPWKIGGDFVSGGSDAEINGIEFRDNLVNKCSIPVNIQDKNISDILIDDNTFKDTDGVIYFWAETGSNPVGILSEFVFTNNDIDLTNTYGIGIDGAAVGGPNFNDSNFGEGNRINYNSFTDISGNYGFNGTSILANLVSYKLNASYNYWGSCEGPDGSGNGTGSAVSSNVIYTPWIGICISNKTNITCAFETDNIDIASDVSGFGLEDVWFSYTMGGINYNKTYEDKVDDRYFYTISNSELTGGYISWNVYANDSFGNVFNNGLKTFYIRNMTNLVVNPTNPDGLNSWYINEPLFSLIKDSDGSNIYYQWDSTGALLYGSSFGLENIPNAPPINSSGILKLKYWSDFGFCGNESIQEEVFNIDLTSPVITGLTPENNEIIYNNPRPTIQALLDEVYQGNSGINKNNVWMKVDDEYVDKNVFYFGSIDAIVRHNPPDDLSEGIHNATVYVEDNAGRFSMLTWSFIVNLSTIDFNLTVHSPQDSSYGSRIIPFNIFTTKNVNQIEYINYNDKRPKWRRLCRNCDEYGFDRIKTKTLKENWNNISIRAVDEFGNTKIVNISLFVDSRNPKISRVLPKRGRVTNGSNFYIKYTENNLKEVLVSWNPVKLLDDCIESGRNKKCYIDLNLSSYDGQYVDFWFNVSDSIRSVKSRDIRVLVDTTSPDLKVNSPENKTGGYGRKVPFNISVSEDVLLEYYDESNFKPRWRRLCSRCDEYGFDRIRMKSFKKGIHKVLIRAVDKAGNSDVEKVVFEVMY